MDHAGEGVRQPVRILLTVPSLRTDCQYVEYLCTIRSLFFFFTRIPLLSLPFFSSLPPTVVVTRFRGQSHSRLSPPPSAARIVPFLFIARTFQLFLLSSTLRVALIHSRRSQQQLDKKTNTVLPRWDSNSSVNSTVVAVRIVEGNHYVDHRGGRTVTTKYT